MKSNFVFSSSSLFIGLFLFFFTENVCSQESADNWTLKQARQWTQKQEWANGLKAMPHKTTDYQEFASQYHKNKKVWDKTFQWLATHDLVNMPAGRYDKIETLVYRITRELQLIARSIHREVLFKQRNRTISTY